MPASCYIAANRYEGCGHQHRTPKAAAKCLPRIDPSRGVVKVWKVARRPARSHKPRSY